MTVTPMTMFVQLWRDERGVVLSVEMTLIVTIVVIGLIVGLAALRDSFTNEFADTGAALGSLNHSYTYNEIDLDLTFGSNDQVNVVANVASSTFADQSDFCEPEGAEGENPYDEAGEAPLCVDFSEGPLNEGQTFP